MTLTNSAIYLPLLGEREIAFNQSRVQQFNDCHRKYWWTYGENLIPDRPRWALDIGTSVHLGLALLGTGVGIDEAVQKSEAKLRELAPKSVLPGDSEDLEDNLEVVRKLLRGYHDKYEGTQQWTPIAQETQGRVEVGDATNVFIIFRTDKLATWNGRLWIVDHKTAGKLDLREMLKYEMSLQVSAYSYGVTRLLKQRVAGVIVDFLVKTKVPQFERDMKLRSDEELVEFEGEWVEQAREIAWRHERVKQGENPRTVFYKNTNECFRYGTCPYRELCLKDNDARRALYKKRPEDYVDDPSKHGLDTIEKGR